MGLPVQLDGLHVLPFVKAVVTGRRGSSNHTLLGTEVLVKLGAVIHLICPRKKKRRAFD